MTGSTNDLGQPVGPGVPNWGGAAIPPRTVMQGRLCRLEPLQADAHGDDLFDAFSADRDGALWTYMPVGPFPSRAPFIDWLTSAAAGDDPMFFAIVDASSSAAVGVAAYMRIKAEVGVIEVGNIAYSPRLQRTAMATEVMYLMMARVFDELGYRRYEWKCDSLNAPSRKAAVRLGFRFDGIFEQAIVYKGRNRDTAWYSILDRDWPTLKCAYEGWLDPANFDERGRQLQSLENIVSMQRER